MLSFISEIRAGDLVKITPVYLENSIETTVSSYENRGKRIVLTFTEILGEYHFHEKDIITLIKHRLPNSLPVSRCVQNLKVNYLI